MLVLALALTRVDALPSQPSLDGDWEGTTSKTFDPFDLDSLSDADHHGRQLGCCQYQDWNGCGATGCIYTKEDKHMCAVFSCCNTRCSFNHCCPKSEYYWQYQHSHSPHTHSPHTHSPHTHSPHTHSPHSHHPHHPHTPHSHHPHHPHTPHSHHPHHPHTPHSHTPHTHHTPPPSPPPSPSPPPPSPEPPPPPASPPKLLISGCSGVEFIKSDGAACSFKFTGEALSMGCPLRESSLDTGAPLPEPTTSRPAPSVVAEGKDGYLAFVARSGAVCLLGGHADAIQTSCPLVHSPSSQPAAVTHLSPAPNSCNVVLDGAESRIVFFKGGSHCVLSFDGSTLHSSCLLLSLP